MTAVVVGVLVWALVVVLIVGWVRRATAGDHLDGPATFVWDIERQQWVLSKKERR